MTRRASPEKELSIGRVPLGRTLESEKGEKQGRDSDTFTYRAGQFKWLGFTTKKGSPIPPELKKH